MFSVISQLLLTSVRSDWFLGAMNFRMMRGSQSIHNERVCVESVWIVIVYLTDP